MTAHQTHASADASRVSTRRGEWAAQMERLILADLERDLDDTRLMEGPFRGIAAIARVENAARRLEALERRAS